MSERTETVTTIIPAPEHMAGGELQRGIAVRADEAFQLLMQEQGLRALSEPEWAYRKLTQEEAVSKFPEDKRDEMAPYLTNAWLATAEVRVAESEEAASR